MKRQLLVLCAAGLLAIPSLAETNSIGSISTDGASIGITSSSINSTTSNTTTSTTNDTSINGSTTAYNTDNPTGALGYVYSTHNPNTANPAENSSTIYDADNPDITYDVNNSSVTYDVDTSTDEPRTVYDADNTADTSGTSYNTDTRSENTATVYDADTATDSTRYNYNSSTVNSSITPEEDSWVKLADNAARDLYFSTLNGDDRATVHNHLSGLSAYDQRSFINLMNNMNTIDRDLWLRSLNSYSPDSYPPAASASSSDATGDTAFTSDISTDIDTSDNVVQSNPDRWFAGFGPVDRTMADQMWVRLSDDERALLTRVMEGNDVATVDSSETNATFGSNSAGSGLTGSLFN